MENLLHVFSFKKSTLFRSRQDTNSMSNATFSWPFGYFGCVMMCLKMWHAMVCLQIAIWIRNIMSSLEFGIPWDTHKPMLEPGSLRQFPSDHTKAQNPQALLASWQLWCNPKKRSGNRGDHWQTTLSWWMNIIWIIWMTMAGSSKTSNIPTIPTIPAIKSPSFNQQVTTLDRNPQVLWKFR